MCSTMGICSDGKVSGQESCDDGNVFPGDGCSSNCSVEPGYYCPTPGKPCLVSPAPLGCGDGQRDPWEACDDGVNDGRYDGCNPDCSLGPHCGDASYKPPTRPATRAAKMPARMAGAGMTARRAPTVATAW